MSQPFSPLSTKNTHSAVSPLLDISASTREDALHHSVEAKQIHQISIACIEATDGAIDTGGIEVGTVADPNKYGAVTTAQLQAMSAAEVLPVAVLVRDIPANELVITKTTTDASEAGEFFIIMEVGEGSQPTS